MINLAPHATAIIERARLRSHCQSVENRVLLAMTVDEVNVLTRFLDGKFGVYRLSTHNAPFAPYLAKWRKQGIFTGSGRVMGITPLGQAIRRKLFGARMGNAGEWASGCDCKMCMEERLQPYHSVEPDPPDWFRFEKRAKELRDKGIDPYPPVYAEREFKAIAKGEL